MHTYYDTTRNFEDNEDAKICSELMSYLVLVVGKIKIVSRVSICSWNEYSQRSVGLRITFYIWRPYICVNLQERSFSLVPCWFRLRYENNLRSKKCTVSFIAHCENRAR